MSFTSLPQQISYQKLTEDAKPPTQGSLCAAGYDLYSIETGILYGYFDVNSAKSNRIAFRTGIRLFIPTGYYGRIAPRSGLALKYGIDVLAGVIDSDYKGEIIVILLNTAKWLSHEIKKGEAIAQVIITPCENNYPMKEIKLSEEDATTSSTERGKRGFGSTDIKPQPDSPRPSKPKIISAMNPSALNKTKMNFHCGSCNADYIFDGIPVDNSDITINPRFADVAGHYPWADRFQPEI